MEGQNCLNAIMNQSVFGLQHNLQEQQLFVAVLWTLEFTGVDCFCI